jgi:hypothetical protein
MKIGRETDEASVVSAIAIASPGVEYRHRDVDRYAELTAAAARRKVSGRKTAIGAPTLRPNGGQLVAGPIRE